VCGVCVCVCGVCVCVCFEMMLTINIHYSPQLASVCNGNAVCFL
jgi:hypothetical protein